MSTRTTAELLTAIRRAQIAQASHSLRCPEWQAATKQLDELVEELRRQTHAAVGSAFSATLLGVSDRDLDVTTRIGDRLLEELRKRGLAVCRSVESPSMKSGGV